MLKVNEVSDDLIRIRVTTCMNRTPEPKGISNLETILHLSEFCHTEQTTNSHTLLNWIKLYRSMVKADKEILSNLCYICFPWIHPDHGMEEYAICSMKSELC